MRTKFILSFLMSMFVSVLSGTGIALAIDVNPLYTTGVITGLSFLPSGALGLRAGVYMEVWTGEILKGFTAQGTFLEKVPSYDRYVNNDVIHLVDIGAKPDVLINNSTYPLTPQSLSDADIPIALDKLETVPTAVSKDELYAISYKKIQVAIELHKEALIEKALDRAIHAFAPASDSTATPIVKTSGADNGNGFKRLTIKDIIALKKAFDDAKIPQKDRLLVLSTQHVADLLLVDQAFQNQYQNIGPGKVLNMYGFEIHEYINTPVFDDTFVKKAFGAAPAGTDRIASVAFYAPRMFRAKGSTDMSYSEASKDPLNKRNLVSFDQRFIALPKKQEAIAALVNDTFV